MSKIKSLIWGYRTEILTVIILVLTVTAAFQLGRLSVIYGSGEMLEIIDSPL